jgi:hypothetical protein
MPSFLPKKKKPIYITKKETKFNGKQGSRGKREKNVESGNYQLSLDQSLSAWVVCFHFLYLFISVTVLHVAEEARRQRRACKLHVKIISDSSFFPQNFVPKKCLSVFFLGPFWSFPGSAQKTRLSGACPTHIGIGELLDRVWMNIPNPLTGCAYRVVL